MPAIALKKAYDRLLRVARAKRFSAPEHPWQWSAEQVLAHVAAADRLLVSAAAHLLTGGAAVYDNSDAVRTEYLDSLIAGTPATGVLTAVVRAAGMELVGLATHVTPEQADARLQVLIYEDGHVVAQGEHSLREVLDLHVAHLALHTDQLKALRRGRINRALV